MNAETKKLYDADPGLLTFDAKVISCRPDGTGRFLAELDQTAFFPEAGGQTPDRGTISFDAGTMQVLDVQIDDESAIITHTLDGELPAGATVTGNVDKAHRFDFMQQHSGEHILSGIICRRFSCDNVGFHLSEQTVTMDYNRALTAEEVASAEEEANAAIWKNLPIEVSFPTEEELQTIDYRSKKELAGRIRIVTIPGVDVCACCAPHVSHTGEIGLLKVLSLQNYKGGVRLTIACGGRALRFLTMQHEVLTGMARSLSTAPEEVPAQLVKLQTELSDAKGVIAALSEQALEAALQTKKDGGNNKISNDILTENVTSNDIITDDTISNDIETSDTITDDSEITEVFSGFADAGAARRVLNRWMENHAGLCGIFLGDDTKGYRYLIGAGKCGSAQADARKAAKCLADALGAKGGGSPQMVQGTVQGREADIRKVFVREALPV